MDLFRFKEIHIINVYGYNKNEYRKQALLLKKFEDHFIVNQERYENSYIILCGDLNIHIQSKYFHGLVNVHNSEGNDIDYQFVSPNLLPAIQNTWKIGPKDFNIDGVNWDHPMLLFEIDFNCDPQFFQFCIQ
eukprot:TRINITY_DN35501_c0_g1_i1.p5 TRINITY_DN35501_c0_g1~~TRINITY_DN35501_c0_g1_i1.p5  ORF type:complete len:132 (-),score=4.23 TRINITY_DN35501_c0_g1_i1:294-689(-)